MGQSLLILIISIFILDRISRFEITLIYLKLVFVELEKEKNPKIINKLEKYIDDIKSYRMTVYIYKIIFIFLFFKTGNYILEQYIEINTFVEYIILFIIYILFIELIPKTLAKKNIYITLIKMLNYINILRIIGYPIIYIAMIFTEILSVSLHINDDIDDYTITEDDIKRFVTSGEDIEEEEQEMIHSIFEFTDTYVKEIMTPRTSIFALEADSILGDVWKELLKQGFSRIPIFEKNIDNIIGTVHIKDVIEYVEKDKNIKLKELIRETYYIPETKLLKEVLEEFRKKQVHLAIIIDEYGGTLGIVTIEDILEEIVGEIRDEYDIEEDSILSLNNNIYDIKGDTLIEEINDELEINIPLSDEYETVSGYVQDKLGKVAVENDQIIEKNYIIKVLEVENKRIDKIKIIINHNGGNNE